MARDFHKVFIPLVTIDQDGEKHTYCLIPDWGSMTFIFGKTVINAKGDDIDIYDGQLLVSNHFLARVLQSLKEEELSKVKKPLHNLLIDVDNTLCDLYLDDLSTFTFYLDQGVVIGKKIDNEYALKTFIPKDMVLSGKHKHFYNVNIKVTIDEHKN